MATQTEGSLMNFEQMLSAPELDGSGSQGGDGWVPGPAASSEKLSVHALRPDKPDIVPGSAPGKTSSSFPRLVHTSSPADSLI